jgi:hypothetical protein
MDDNFDDVHDVPLIYEAQKPLYEGSRMKYSLYYFVVGELESIE